MLAAKFANFAEIIRVQKPHGNQGYPFFKSTPALNFTLHLDDVLKSAVRKVAAISLPTCVSVAHRSTLSTLWLNTKACLKVP